MEKMTTHQSKARRGVVSVWRVDAIVGRRRVLRHERGGTARGIVRAAIHGPGSRLSLLDVGKIGSAVASPAKGEQGED